MFDAIFAPQRLLDELGDRAWLQAMLDSERALALAEAEAGLIPSAAAEAIAACCRAELFESARIAQEGRGSGNPAEPLVRALRAAVGDEGAGPCTTARRARTSSTPPRCSSAAGRSI